MGSASGISEIEESSGESHHAFASKECGSMCCTSKQGNNTKKQLVSIISHDYSVERQINQLFEAIEFKAASHSLESQVGPSWKNASKRPMTAGPMQASGIGISEVVTLKQALRGLCISHASELASLKRKTKPVGLPSLSESVTPKHLYGSGFLQVAEPSQSVGTNEVPTAACGGILSNPKICNPTEVVHEESEQEIIVVPDNKSNLSQQASMSRQSPAHSSSRQKPGSSLGLAVETLLKPIKTKPSGREAIVSAQSKSRLSVPKLLHHGKVVSASSTPSGSPTVHSERSSSKASPRMKRVTRKTKKHNPENEKQDPDGSSKGPSPKKFDGKAIMSGSCSSKHSSLPNNTDKSIIVVQSSSPASNSNSHAGVSFHNSETNGVEYHELLSDGCQCEHGVKKLQNSKPREKGECSQSSLSSIGEYSSSSGVSDESGASISSFHGNRPHMSKDSKWSAISHAEMYHGILGLRHFKLVKRLGCGDIGSVYLAALMGTNAQFALKVMDIDFLMSRKKMLRAQTEREILQMLDHPFLPTLYAHFATDKLLCLVMQYCPGGDLHVLLQRQPNRFFSEQAARFYAAEVLLALEYLHMLGVIYRDLKPENVLVREDGHIMLSDFDLSLRCAANPTLVETSFTILEGPRLSEVCAQPRCIDPLCPEPRWTPVSCFTPKLMPPSAKGRRAKVDSSTHIAQLPQLVVEPTSARSNSFVGTHEYLAPEIIRGDGHGSSVDWWTFGIFLYELIHGKTPFKGADNQETLANAVSQNLKFPEYPSASHHAKDLITRLLSKDPDCRLGSVRGAAEIKSHPFFDGLNWALIRSTTPPEVSKPDAAQSGIPAVASPQVKMETKKPLQLKVHQVDHF